MLGRLKASRHERFPIVADSGNVRPVETREARKLTPDEARLRAVYDQLLPADRSR